MNLTKLLVIPAILATSVLSAQQTYVDPSGGVGLIYSKKAPSEPAQGTQYFIENFYPAKFDGSDDVTLVRYNAYTDEMEAKVNDEIMVIQPKEDVTVRLMNNQAAYEYIAYKDEDNNVHQNYLVLVSDNPNVKIYKREQIYLKPEEHPSGGYQKYKAPMYKKLNPEYYIQFKDGDVVYMSTKKKDVYDLIPGKETDVKKFVKENRLSTSDDQDLNKLGNYMNTLVN